MVVTVSGALIRQGWDMTLRINFVRRKERDARGGDAFREAKRVRGGFANGPYPNGPQGQWGEPVERQREWQLQMGNVSPQTLAMQSQAAQMGAMQMPQARVLTE